MCSISGIYDYLEGECPPLLLPHVMCHRGPDACGDFREGRVCLHHDRLAVIDPEGGAQPMSRTHRGVRQP